MTVGVERDGYTSVAQHLRHHLDRLLQSLAERRVDDRHLARRQPGFELASIHTLDLQRVHPVELHATYGRLQVTPDHLLMALPGAIPDRALDRIEPPVEIASQREVLAVASDTLVPVGQKLAVLPAHLRLRLSRDVTALALASSYSPTIRPSPRR